MPAWDTPPPQPIEEMIARLQAMKKRKKRKPTKKGNPPSDDNA